MNKNRFFFVLFLATLVGFTSCKEDDNDDPKPQGEAQEIDFDANKYTEWVYVSLEKGEVVGTSPALETLDNLDWDIAFHKYNVRLNGGKSGKGKGSALLVKDKIGKTGWDEIIEAPTTGYKADEMLQISYIRMGGDKKEVGGSNVITGPIFQKETFTFKAGTWLKMPTMGEFVSTDQIFVITTAKGNYAKLWLKSYTGDDGKGGHITMKYFLQKDGSRKLQ